MNSIKEIQKQRTTIVIGALCDKSHSSEDTRTCEPDALAVPLPLSSAHESLQTLTRSQRLFSIYTGVDARALKIESGPEFFLFMEMRHEGQWASFSMNSRKWAVVTAEYNRRLEARSCSPGQLLIPKNPRALMEKLGEVEAQVIQRISTGNFECEFSLLCRYCIDLLTNHSRCIPVT